MPQSARVEGESETVASLPPSGREGDRDSGGRRKRKKRTRSCGCDYGFFIASLVQREVPSEHEAEGL